MIHLKASVWSFNLHKIRFSAAYNLLNIDEKQRLHKLDHEKTHEFACARASLRLALSLISQKENHLLSFEYTTHGKPFCPQIYPIQFNLSHSHGKALIVVSPSGSRLGVDIEQQRTVDAHRLAKRFYSKSEQSLLQRCTADSLSQTFFNIWTRKEACIKMLGTSIATDLQSFSVNANTPATFTESMSNPQEGGKWQLIDIPQYAHYSAALCLDREHSIEFKNGDELWR